MKKIAITIGLLLLLIHSSTQAQINKPSLSPTVTSVQKVGLSEITLTYGQPNMQGRTIFGELIPYGKLWRTGANASTKFTTDKDIVIAGLSLPAGTYGLYSIPGQKEWTVIFHKKSKLWGSAGYNAAEEFGRVTIPTHNLKDTRETLNISFENFTADGASLSISWENTQVLLPVIVNSDAIILAEITQKITNATGEIKAQTYFDAAQFYQFKNIDINQAAIWYDKAIEINPNAFWFSYYRAEVALLQGNKKLAEEIATLSLAQAKAQLPSTDYGYISKNELLLKKIKQ